MRKFKIDKPDRLLSFLFAAFPDSSKTRIREFLKKESVEVNGRTVTQFDFPLRPGDEVVIDRPCSPKKIPKPLYDVRILYEDDSIIAAHKPPKLLTISTDKIKDRTVFYAVNDYLNRKEESNQRSERSAPLRKKQIFLIHRLDRDASGVILFAKDEESKFWLQAEWPTFEKKYYALVEGVPEQEDGVLESWLTENKILRVYSGPKTAKSKFAVTHFRRLEDNGKFALLEVLLETGRKHQIRVHLADLGHPIVGDKDYESTLNPLGRLGLHAFQLRFLHPKTGEKMEIQSPLPIEFKRVIADKHPT